ncbi:MAG: 2Fe-2S iron-sulfur cluster-binding protein [Planctomycetota bacterium JB042]
MPTIRRDDTEVELEPGETVLDGLLRAGAHPLYSCRVGACLTCLSRAVEGTPPADAQEPLSDAERGRGLFLACIAVPDGDLVVGDAT